VSLRCASRSSQHPSSAALRILLGGLLGGLALAPTLVPAPGRAAVPMATFPKCGETDRPDLCPSEIGQTWDLISYVRPDAREGVRKEELSLGSGIWLDRALRTTAGRFDVIVAIGDSGISWSSADLLNKYFLNTAELPLPQDALGQELPAYDADGNGLVNIQDYIADPRVDWSVGPDGWAGVLDPSDLIATFGDGVDDDGNGYTDDICGWDFFNNDNDAFHTYNDGYGTHGEGVAKEAAGEGDGGGGDIGECPNCAILPVRVGDTFVTDGTRSAEGILYATDMGAVAISQAVGAMSSPDTARAAVNYAFEHGTLVVGAAGDENQYHHNFPAMMDNVMYVKSLHFSGSNEDNSYSYLNTWNCNNYGPRLVLAASSDACATGAVAKITGLAGLVQSAARDAGTPLSAGELYQVLTHTADDVWLPETERATAKAYPSDEGWDAFHGYGRVNAAHAVEAVAAGQIPPVATLDTPRWFDTIDPLTHGSLDIEAHISADRSSGYDWVLEWGRGVDPRDWTPLATGIGTTATQGVIATMDLAALDEVPVGEPTKNETDVERLIRAHGPTVTLRLTVTDAQGLQGEMRKAFHVVPDPDLLPGFPVALDGSAEGSPVLADLDDDGVFEVLVASTSGTIHALHGDGSELPGWPTSTAAMDRPWFGTAPAYTVGDVPVPRETVVAAPAVGDIDGDGMPEVVVATGEGRIWAWHTDGSLVSGFPYQAIGRAPEEFDTLHTYDQGFAAAPTLADIDDDGALEIIEPGMDSRLYVVTGTGADFGPYPVEICHPDICGTAGFRIIASSAVGDVDGDGDLDIVQGTNEQVSGKSVTHMLDAKTGQPLAGWPHLTGGLVNGALLLPLIGEGHPASPALADIDHDGQLEILDPIMLGQTDIIGVDGSSKLDLSYVETDYGIDQNTGNAPSLVQLSTDPAFGDLDGDGVPDPVIGGSSSLYLASLAASFWMDGQHPVAAWSGATGAYLQGWPRQIEDMQLLTAPTIADISGDGRPEVVYGSGGYLVHAWDADGNEPVGWPKNTGQWLMGAAALGDIDGDGYLDAVVTTREGQIFAWSTDGRADQDVQWQSQFHDAQNTGSYETPLVHQDGPADDTAIGPPDKKCGSCGGKNKESGAGGLLLLLAPLSLAGLRRRRGPWAD